MGRGGGGKLLASVLVGDTDLLTRRGRRKVEETGANENKQNTHMLFLFIASVVVLSVWLPAGALLGFFTLAATTVLFLPALGVRRGGVTGTAQLSWKVVPSQIQRCAFALGILALLGAVSVATTQDWLASPRIGVGLRYVAGTGLAAACILASHLRQRRYWLTDKGLFCATASVLGSLGNRSVAARPIAMWADLVSFEVGQCEIVLRLRTDERNRGLLLGSAEAKVPLVGLTSDRLPEMSAELAGQIVARIRQHGAGASESVAAARPAQGKGPKPDGGLSARDASEGAPVPAARTRWQRVRPVVLTWALLSVLTSAPYLAAALDPPPGRTFVGFFFYPGDMLLTASYVKQAEDGAFLFKNKLYLGDQRASYVNLEWWVVGILSRLLGGNPALAYRLFGLVVSFFFVAAVDRWLRRAALPDSHRLPALVLTMTAAGLGGMRFSLLHSPRIACLDFIAGLFPIWELLYDPLLVTGTTLLLWSLEAFTDARDRRGALRAGLVVTLLGLVRPYDLAVVAGIRVVAVMATSPPRDWLRRLAPLLGLVPVFLYNVIVLLLNPAFSCFSSGVFRPPAPGPFVWAFAPAFLLATSVFWLRGRARPSMVVWSNLVAWIAVGAMVIVAPPVNYSIQFLAGVGLACLVLGALGLQRWKPVVTWAIAALMSTTAIACVTFMLKRPARWFVAQERWDAARALRDSCRLGGRLWAPSDIGQLAGALTGCSPIVSHFAMSDYQSQNTLVESFYQRRDPLDPAERSALLTRFRITHLVLLGDAGRQPTASLGPDTPFRRVALVGYGNHAISLYARPADHISLEKRRPWSE